MFQALAGLLAFYYDLIPSYAMAITLLTLTVMLVLFPLTLKSTRNMLEMQRLQPALRDLQQKYKGDRQKLNEEMMAFYKEHQVNPVAGCLPMLLQLPVFMVMYRVIHGLSHQANGVADPKYVSHTSALYKAIKGHNGKLLSFGIDLGESASKVMKESKGKAIPFIILVLLVVVTQYIQTRQMTARNPQAAAANPQTQMMTRVMPAFFGFISFGIPAGVNVYFLVSALFRIAQQEAMYRWDPHVSAHAPPRDPKDKVKPIETKSQDVSKERFQKDLPKGMSGGSGGNGKGQPNRNKSKKKKGR